MSINKTLCTVMQGILSLAIPANERKYNYERFLQLPVPVNIADDILRTLRYLDEKEELFPVDVFPSADFLYPEYHRFFVRWQQEPSLKRVEFLRALRQLEIYLLQDTLTGKSKWRPTEETLSTANNSTLSTMLKDCGCDRGGINLGIPDWDEIMGPIEPGARLVIGGFAGAWKTIFLQQMIAAALQEKKTSVLWVSSSHSSKEILLRISSFLKEEFSSVHTKEASGMSDLNRGLWAVGSEILSHSGIAALRAELEMWAVEDKKQLIVVIDDIEGIAQLVIESVKRKTDSVPVFLEWLSEIIGQFDKPIGICATYCFTERTFLAMKRRIRNHSVHAATALSHFGAMDSQVDDLILKMIDIMDYLEHDFLVDRDDYLASRSESVRMAKELFRKFLDVRTSTKQEILDDIQNTPKGQYFITAFQDPPEIERFFDICISFWLDEQVNTHPPNLSARSSKAVVLARLLKNRNLALPQEVSKLEFNSSGGSLPRYINGRVALFEPDCSAIDELLGGTRSD